MPVKREHAIAYIAHWDGKQWKITENPRATPSTIVSLSAVTAISKQNVWAVGISAYETVIAHWNGTRWSLVPSPKTNERGSNL